MGELKFGLIFYNDGWLIDLKLFDSKFIKNLSIYNEKYLCDNH